MEEKTVKEYTAQIYPSGSLVRVAIIYRNKEVGMERLAEGLYNYYSLIFNVFGTNFRNSPREKDYVKANKWADEQLDLIRKHATGIVKKPQYITDRERS